MLGIVFTVLSVSVACHADKHNSSSDPMLLVPPPVVSRRMASDLVNTLRRQLMRDNYDYQNGNSAERRKQNATRNQAASNLDADQRMLSPSEPDQPEQPLQPGQTEPLAQFVQFEETQEPEPPPPREQPQQRPQRSRFEQRKRYDNPHQQQSAKWPRYRDPAPGAPPNDELDVRDIMEADQRDRNDAYDRPYVNKRRDALNEMQVAPVSSQRHNNNQQQRREQGDRDNVREEGPLPPHEPNEMNNPPPENEPHDNPEEEDPLEQQNDQEWQGGGSDHQDDAAQSEHSNQQDAPEQQNDQASEYNQGQTNYDEFTERSTNRPSGPQPPRPQQVSKKDLLYYMDETNMRRNYISSDDDDHSSLDEDASDEQDRSGNGTFVKHTNVNASRPTSSRPLPNGIVPNLTAPYQSKSNFSRISNITRLNKMRRAMNEQSNVTLRPRVERTPQPRRFVVTVSGANVTYKLLTMKSRDRRRSGPRRFLEERAPGSVALISLDKAPLPAFRLPRMRRQYMHERHDHRNPLDDIIPHHRRHND